MRFPPFYAFFHCLQFAAMISFLRFEISHAPASKSLRYYCRCPFYDSWIIAVNSHKPKTHSGVNKSYCAIMNEMAECTFFELKS